MLGLRFPRPDFTSARSGVDVIKTGKASVVSPVFTTNANSRDKGGEPTCQPRHGEGTLLTRDWPDGSASALGGLLDTELHSVLTGLLSGPVSVLAESSTA